MKMCSADFQFKNVFGCRIRRKSALRRGSIFANTEFMHRPNSSLHFNIKQTYQIRTGKLNASAQRLLPATLLERLPKFCRAKITFEILPQKLFVSARTNPIRCFVKWIPVNMHVRWNKPQPCLKGGSEPFGNEIDEILGFES